MGEIPAIYVIQWLSPFFCQIPHQRCYAFQLAADKSIRDRANKKLSHESTQTQDEIFTAGVTWPPDVSSPGPHAVEEYIISEATSTVASVPFELDSLLEDVDASPRIPAIEIEDVDEESERWLHEFCYKPQDKHVVPSDMISDGEPEPEIMSSRTSKDSLTDDLAVRLQLLENMNDGVAEAALSGRTRTDTGYSVDLNFDEPEPLPPPPDSSPPPLPCEPPPDFVEDSSPPKMDPELEALLASDSSPPRDSATLRAFSRQRLQPESRRTLEEEVEDLLAEDSVVKETDVSFAEPSPVVEENEVDIEGEPSEYGSAPVYAQGTSFWRPPALSPSSSKDLPDVHPDRWTTRERPILGLKKVGALERPDIALVSQPFPKKVPPRTLPKPSRPSFPLPSPSSSLLSMTSPARLSSTLPREEPDGTGPLPRGTVRARANSLNRGEVGVLNEKIGFLEKQLKVSQEEIRTRS